MMEKFFIILQWKSTILNLIPRFYNADDGDIRIDSQSIYDCKVSSLRRYISLVSQDIILFDDSVENNIKYAKLGASDEEIKKACELAAANEFTLPYGVCVLNEEGYLDIIQEKPKFDFLVN